MVALNTIDQLVTNSSNIGLITGLDWIIVPVLNPDGYVYTFEVVSILDHLTITIEMKKYYILRTDFGVKHDLYIQFQPVSEPI